MAGSTKHRFLSGAGGQAIEATELAGTGIAVNRLLISNAAGGWTTVLSSAVGGGGGGDPVGHAFGHSSGGADPINVQNMQASGVAGNMIFMTSGTANASIVTIASSTFALQADFSNASSSFATVSSSFSPLSNSFAAISASYKSFSASFAPVSASYAVTSASFVSTSASFAGISASFVSHKSRHLSGGVDQIDAQGLAATGIALDRLLIANGLGGWTTIAQSSLIVPVAAHASTHSSGSTDAVQAQNLGASGIAVDRFLISNALGGWTTVLSSTFDFKPSSASFATVSASFSPLSNSFATISASFINASASFATISASFSPLSNSFATISASFINSSASFATVSASFSPLSNSFTAISASFIGFSGAHASRHLSGGADPIDAQSLRANAIAIDRLLISNGVGGWTTVATSSLSLPAAPHAATHNSGASDAVQAQNLGASGIAVDRLLISNALGGWTTVLSQTFDFKPSSASFATVSASFSPLSNSFATISASFINSSASFATVSASFGPLSNSFATISASFINSSASFATVSASFGPLSNSFAAISASFINSSASFATVSASFSPLSNSFAAISASFINSSASFATVSSSFSPLSNSFAMVSASFIGFSGSHGSRHLSGGTDPLDAQSLRANAIAIDRLLISNGLGGWTTVASASVGGAGAAASVLPTSNHYITANFTISPTGSVSIHRYLEISGTITLEIGGDGDLFIS